MTTAAWSNAPHTDAEPSDTYSAVTRVESVSAPERPVLRRSVSAALDAIIEERLQAEALRRHRLEPTRSLLLTGAPGVGKTMSARYLAGTLGVPLISIDLASVMSSYLGETGRNLRRALDVARGIPCVFLIDEIDALAKHRSDVAEMGELKRLVNVLLLELERWPSQSLLVGATNHPELLDRAIWRRFDRVITLGRPGRRARRQLLERTMESHGRVATERALSITVAATEGSSAAALRQLARDAVRGCILGELKRMHADAPTKAANNGSSATERRVGEGLNHGPGDLDALLVQLAMARLERVSRKHPEARGAFCALAISELGLTQREIGSELGISHVSVGRLARAWEKAALTRPHRTDTDG
jgi:SpoVK/Ycf46/Vps4 family AAA+-type ATPase